MVLGATALANPAQAAPANDNWADATEISALPFVTSEADIVSATVEVSDPDPPCRQLNEPSVTNTLWYTYTTGANTEYVTLTVPGIGGVIGIVSVYTGTPGAFKIVSAACNSYSDATHSARIAGLRLTPNTTYSIEVGAMFGVNQGNVLDFSFASAQQYLITKTQDTADGACDADCSLREAISASNANPGAVIIPAGTFTLAIAGPNEYDNLTGDLDATQGMGIYGAGMRQTIIDANHLDRAIFLNSKGAGQMAFVVGDLTIKNGSATVVPASPNPFSTAGGGLASFGGSGQMDFVALERIAVLSSVAGESGGGIAMASPGSIRDCLIEGNVANGSSGGGLYLTVDQSYEYRVSGSTFSSNNVAAGLGGGIYAQATLSLVNSTISGNNSEAYGGGIYSDSNGSLSMANDTVVWNSAYLSNPSKPQSGAGITLSGNAQNSIIDSIIAYNTAGNALDNADCLMFANQDNTLVASYNLVQRPDDTCPIAVGDKGIDPGVSSTLANNGGPTPTHALKPDSAAADSGDPAGCKDTDGLALAYDQRGVPRPVDLPCDKGAVESDTLFRDGLE